MPTFLPINLSSPHGTTTTPYDRTKKIDWVIPVTLNVLLMIVTLWLLISLIHYGIKTKKWKSHQRKVDYINSGLIYSSVVACAVMCMFRYVVSLVYMNVGFHESEDELCDSVADTLYCAYAFVLFCAAMFLWFRQRALYAHRLLNVNYNKIVRFFSLTCFVFFFAYALFVIILNNLPNSFLSSSEGCVVKPNGNLNANYWIAAAAGIAFYNIALLSLLYYALTHVQTFQKKLASKRYESKRAQTIANTNFNSEPSSTNFRPLESETSVGKMSTLAIRRKYATTQKIKTALQKTLVFAVISIISETFLQIYAIFIANPLGHRRVSSVLFDVNSFLNLICLIFSFSSSKEMMTSPLIKTDCRNAK